MQEDRRDAAETDEDGGRGDEVFFSAGKPLNAGLFLQYFVNRYLFKGRRTYENHRTKDFLYG